MSHYYQDEYGTINQSNHADLVRDLTENKFLNYTKLPTAKGRELYRQQCVARLLGDYGIRDGSRIYANVTSVSASGMSRTIEFYIISTYPKDPPTLDRITHLVSGAQEYPINDKGLKIGGCGMDMVFAALDGLCGIPANNLDIRRL